MQGDMAAGPRDVLIGRGTGSSAMSMELQGPTTLVGDLPETQLVDPPPIGYDDSTSQPSQGYDNDNIIILIAVPLIPGLGETSWSTSASEMFDLDTSHKYNLAIHLLNSYLSFASRSPAWRTSHVASGDGFSTPVYTSCGTIVNSPHFLLCKVLQC